MNARILFSAAFALVSVVFASGCIEGGACDEESLDEAGVEDGDCGDDAGEVSTGDDAAEEDEDLATGESAISVNFDAKAGCERQGKVWYEPTQTCKTPRAACEAAGDYWSGDRQQCFYWGSIAHKEDLCAHNGLVYAGDFPANLTVGNMSVRCEAKPQAPGGFVPGPNPGEGIEMPCEPGLLCFTDPNPNSWTQGFGPTGYEQIKKPR